MAEVAEGSVMFDEVKKYGNSLVLLLTAEDKEYLGIEEGDKIVKKYDVSPKQGRFIELGKKKA